MQMENRGRTASPPLTRVGSIILPLRGLLVSALDNHILIRILAKS